MRHYLPFSKVEDNGDGTVTVTGVASSEATDNAGEIIRSDAIKAALPDYLRLGTGALREMHGLSAAGTVDEATVDDDTKKTFITATVVDPIAVKKINKRVYKGFSIGGKVTGRDEANRKIITGVRLAEISLVDSPCNPDAVFDMWKADGVDTEDEVPLDEPDDQVTKADADLDQSDAVEADDKPIVLKHASGTEVHIAGDGSVEIKKRDFNTKERKKDAKSGAAMPDGSFPIENKSDLRNAIRLAGKAKNPSAARAHIKRRAKALGAEDMIPDSWKSGSKTEKADGMTEQTEKAVDTGASDDNTKPADTEAAKADTAAAKTDTSADKADAAAAAKPDEGAEAEKADIAPKKITDVLGDGDTRGTAGTPVAGATVSATYPPGKGADAATTSNPATAGNDGQDSLSTSSVAPVETSTAETPTDGVDQRSHKAPAEKADVADPISKAEAALKKAQGAIKALDVRAGYSNVPAPFVEGMELRKGMYSAGRLGSMLCDMAYLVMDSQFEADMEGDNSPVPGKLREVLKAMASVYREMSDEEVTELLASADPAATAKIALAAAGGDLSKMVSSLIENQDLLKADPDYAARLLGLDIGGERLKKAEADLAAMKDERDALLKTTSDLTDGLERLAKRVEELAAEPMPSKTLTKAAPVQTVVAVSKEEDTAGITKADAAIAKPTLSTDDAKKALDSMSPEDRAELLVKLALHPSQARTINGIGRA